VSPRVVVALPVEETAALLRETKTSDLEVAAALALLEMAASQPCLTLIAGYPPSFRPPPWDLLLPDESDVLQLVSHDSSKREAPRDHVLVMQARAPWSRERLQEPTEVWAGEILSEAARILGETIASPRWTQAHRWRWSRIDRGTELSGPMRLHSEGGGVIGLAGEYFAPGGGIEAAWRSGQELARRLLDEE